MTPGKQPVTSTSVPPVPAACPPERRVELESARTATVLDLRAAELAERTARAARAAADSTLLGYDNLVAEVNGQGRLDL